MLPDRPSLVKCPHCKTLIWIGEQKQVGEVDHRNRKAMECIRLINKKQKAITRLSITFQNDFRKLCILQFSQVAPR